MCTLVHRLCPFLKGPPYTRPYINGYIDERQYYTRWLLEGSEDGNTYFVIEDKTDAKTDLPHDLVVNETGYKARYINCSIKELPYNQKPCLSYLRVFGIGEGDLPGKAVGIKTELINPFDLIVEWDSENAVGANVLWGFQPDKLYHSYMVLGRECT